MYQHTGEKPFKCLYCTEEFVTKRGLQLHHNNKHPEQMPPLGLPIDYTLLKKEKVEKTTTSPKTVGSK